uniref:Uncharacterized protein n=1 Tax=Arundo donax TaxID=35708 RepID=A0A0A9C246_ARUDO
MLPRCIFGLSPNSPKGGRSNQNRVHYTFRRFLLHHDAFRLEKRWCNLPARHATLPGHPNRAQHRSLWR